VTGLGDKDEAKDDGKTEGVEENKDADKKDGDKKEVKDGKDV